MSSNVPCSYGYFRPDKDSDCKIKTLGKFKKNDKKKNKIYTLKI